MVGFLLVSLSKSPSTHLEAAPVNFFSPAGSLMRFFTIKRHIEPRAYVSDIKTESAFFEGTLFWEGTPNGTHIDGRWQRCI